ncbi:MAG TPA: PQQ-binding-like beta-propeller repeat protein [Gaiellaceae bacterium]|nr:PQQ-binding-like beta-propeller repeat protein [Gaiellaceae bacterium]
MPLAVILVAAALSAACGSSGAPNGVEGAGKTIAASSRDWTRFGWDARRSNDDPHATGITAANVQSLVRRQVRLPGTVDSSAIYLRGASVHGARHDAFFVTTTYGITLAIDATTGKILWRWTPPSYSHLAGSAEITTATPVADPSRKWIYTASPDGQIQKLTVASGRVVWRSVITKLPFREKIASSLNFTGGHVIATTGGYIGDTPPYQGHVVVLAARNGRLLHIWNSLCSNEHRLLVPSTCPASDSAIWGRSGAVVVPGSGKLLVATGNAPWNGRTNWGDAVLVLSSRAELVGNYTPTNTEELNSSDLDLGSTSPVYLTPKVVAQGGKDGKIRLLSLARLRGTKPHRGREQQIVSTPSGTDLFTAPAVWRSGKRVWLIAADGGATQAWSLRSGRLHSAWRVANGGTSPVIAGGLLWVYDPGGGGLRVYRPASGKLVATLPAGSGHWNSPIVADGRVALPEGDANDHATNGVLDIWRLPG